MLIDTHSHIYSEDFNSDIDEVIARAYENNVRKIILPNIDSSSVRKMLDLADNYPQVCYPLMGLHPTSVNEDYEEELALVDYWLKKRKFYGIGEIGIDLYWETAFLEEQKIVFTYQLRLAKKYKLPVVIHVRDSFDEVFEILKVEKTEDLIGIFHSFSGSLEHAQKIIDLDFKIGVGGVVTFKNAGLDKILGAVDPKHMVLETDAPYLTPVPNRGKRNESANLIYIAQKIADLHQAPVDEIAKITTENALGVFRI